MNKTVQDGIGHSGIADEFMLTGGQKLTGDQSGGHVLTVVQDFQKVPILDGLAFPDGVFMMHPLQFASGLQTEVHSGFWEIGDAVLIAQLLDHRNGEGFSFGAKQALLIQLRDNSEPPTDAASWRTFSTMGEG